MTKFFAILFCVPLLTAPMTCAASPTNTHDAKTKPYWSKPNRKFWTPANAQKQLEEDAKQAVCVRIYGGGRFWHALTGLPTDSEIIKSSRIDPEAKGILIQNKQLIRLMPSLFHHSDKVLEGKYLVQADTLEIEMCGGLDQNGFDQAALLWWDGKAYCYRPMIGALELKPGNGTQFNGFIRQMAYYARTHRHGVSFYRYNVYKLSPT